MTAVAPPVLDPSDPAFRADPHRAYRALREFSPVHRLADRGDWAVTGYHQVRSLLHDPRTALALPAQEAPPTVASSPNPGVRPLARSRQDGLELFAAWMHGRDAVDHARLRRLSRPEFSPAAVEARRARVEALVQERVGRGAALGRMDVVGDLGRPLSLAIAAELVGIPAALQPALEGWAREMVHRVEIWPTPAGRERGLLAMMALAPRLRELLRAWRAGLPGAEGLLWRLEGARAEGALTEDEVLSHAVLFFFAGHATTQHLIGNGALTLLRHPEQWEILQARPELIGSAVDETLRYETPAPAIQRVAVEDIELDGQTIGRGEPILLLLAAAHRDPAVFSDPDRFDVTRSPNPHLGFGHDAHYCMGAALARLEAEVAIGALVRRSPPPGLPLEPVEWEDSFVVRGLKSLPIGFE